MIPLKRLTRRRKPETLVALVDVVFFLLVFALLIGRMDATAPFEVIPPLATSGADLPAGGTTISLATGETALDGAKTTPAELRLRLAKRITADPDMRIRIQADQTLRLRDVLPLITELTTMGASDIVLVVTPGA